MKFNLDAVNDVNTKFGQLNSSMHYLHFNQTSRAEEVYCVSHGGISKGLKITKRFAATVRVSILPCSFLLSYFDFVLKYFELSYLCDRERPQFSCIFTPPKCRLI
jgi:hypothetical protein